MSECRSCKALCTGRLLDGLCSACALENRKHIFADPTNMLDWVNRQLMRNWSAGVDSTPHFSSGRCTICGKALDDHGLCYSPQKYAIGLCQKVKK